MASEEESVTFAIDLESNIPETGKAAAESLEALRNKILGGTEALREMQAAQRRLQASTVIDVASMRKLRDEIAGQKAAVASAQAAYISLGGTFGKLDKQVQSASRWRSLLEVFGKIPGPIGEAARKMNLLTDKEFAAKAASVGLKAASIGLGLATAYAAEQTLKYGFAQADARRNELLRLEGLTKIRRFMFGFTAGPKADNASFLQEQIDRVSDSVSIGREKVAGYTEELYRMGFRGGRLQEALEGLATAAAGGGEEGAAQFKMMAGQALYLGQSLKAVTADAKARFGPIVKAQMLSLGVQTEKFLEKLPRLFTGLKIEPVLEALHEFLDVFSTANASGRALRDLLSHIFNPILDGIASVRPFVEGFFYGMILAALQFGIEIFKLRNLFRKVFGDISLFRGLDWMKVGVYAGAAAFLVLAAAIGYAAFALASLLAPLLAVGAAIVAVGAFAFQLFKLWQEVHWKDLGKALILGILHGIESGQAWVINTIRTLAGSIWKKFKETLQISSPSRLMIKAALEVPKGIAAGIALGAPDVARAMQLASPTELYVREPGRNDKTSLSTDQKIYFGDIHVHGTSTDEPEDFARRFRQQLHIEMRGAAASMGAGKL